MKRILLSIFFYTMICSVVSGQNVEVDFKINEIKEYIHNGGDLNSLNENGVCYYQHYIWAFGFYCDTTELPIVRYLVGQEQKLKDPFWFTKDHCPGMGNYIFYYVLLLYQKGYELKTEALIELIDIYFLPRKDFWNLENINYLDYYDKTPLMYACEMWDENLIKYLLLHGAKPEFKNKKGQKSSDFCNKRKIKKLMKWAKFSKMEFSPEMNIL